MIATFETLLLLLRCLDIYLDSGNFLIDCHDIVSQDMYKKNCYVIGSLSEKTNFGSFQKVETPQPNSPTIKCRHFLTYDLFEVCIALREVHAKRKNIGTIHVLRKQF